MYEYDLCLSTLLHAWEDAAKVLREHEGQVPHKLRLSGSVCLDCFGKDYTDTQLTDVDVDEISKRWWKLGILRDLYLDEAISRDFDKYKVQFVSQGSGYLRLDGNRPMIEENPELAIESNPNPNHKYAPDFKARFYQSLCLHSIARVTRSHAMYSRDQVQNNVNSPNSIGTRLFRAVGDLWVKHHIELNGHAVQLSHHAQFDRLEIYDFVFYFLLEKVIPFSALESWTTEAGDRYPYDETEGGLDSWVTLLYHCRLTFLPSDIVDLVKHKTWRTDSNFPADKTNYMCERGLFDLGGDAFVDFHTHFSRHSIIHGTSHSLCSGSDILDEDKFCLWDVLRVRLGSPFRPGFSKRLDLEVSSVDPVEVCARHSRCHRGNP